MHVEDLANGKVCEAARRVLERALRAYHGAELHGGAQAVTKSLLADLFANPTRRAFADADNLPSDHDIFVALREERFRLLGEGYHIVALTEPARRFVVKYAKSPSGLPPLASAESLPPPEHWCTDHGVGTDGRVHPAIWQHIRAFESYGRLTVPNRVYIAGDVLDSLDRQERTSLDRYAALGIVRSMGGQALAIRPEYPDDFADVKQPPDGRVLVSVFVVQPIVTPLTEAIEHDVLLGDSSRARYWQDRYHEFVEALWGHGISHLDFSLLNVGVTRGEQQRLVIFDPHMGAIELSAGGEEIADPFSPNAASERGLDDLLRAARDGSRWALWRIQESAAETPDVPDERVSEAADLVREFHEETTDVAHGTGPFSRSRFYGTWRRGGSWDVNDVARAQLDQLLGHPLFEDLNALITESERMDVYDRAVAVHGEDGAELPQFRARLQVYDERPLLLVTNLAEDVPRLTKHWGSLILPPELKLQDDPAIQYHLRDLLTGEVYARSGEELLRVGMRIGLAPFELHALQIEDIWVQDLALEQMLATTTDLRDLVALCTPVVAAVGDIHGELPALQAILRDLRITDSSDHWCADDATLILTGDVGHGPDLQQTFDFIKRLAAQAHSLGGGIVWTLGNHDLYADKEGGQGGERSLGYALWPQVRDIVLHPDRAIGLTVTAAYYCHGKIFVHGGILPDVVRMAEGERGAGDAETVVDYINTVFRAAISTRDRVRASDLPHEIFRTGTSHAREPRLPGDVGYAPAGIFTPDLRELDHYRYHEGLLPQVVGHTASAKGRIRSSPGSRFRRQYIAIDVGRQHGFGNGGLFLTRLGWTSTAPGEPARLVEASALFRQLAHECLRTAGEMASDGEREAHLLRTARKLLRPPESGTPTQGERRERLYVDLPGDQLTMLASYFSSITETGR